MHQDNKLKALLDINDTLGRMPFVATTRLEEQGPSGSIRVVIKLDSEPVACLQKGTHGFAYLPKDEQLYDLRTLTNPLRRVCRKAHIDFIIEAPRRHYISRSSSIKEFAGYGSPEVILNII